MAMPRHERNFICIGHECHRELAEYVVFSLDALAEVEQNGNINVSKKKVLTIQEKKENGSKNSPLKNTSVVFYFCIMEKSVVWS